MSDSNSGTDVVLYVSVSYPLLLRVLRELNPNDAHQRKIADELIGRLRYAIAVRAYGAPVGYPRIR